MKRFMITTMVALVASLALGCSKASSPTNTGVSSPASAPVVAPAITPAITPKGPPERGRWSCAKDGDCRNSCRYGAVSAAWYKANSQRISECEDGCHNQISGPPKCISGECAAFTNRGAPRKFCTKRRVD